MESTHTTAESGNGADLHNAQASARNKKRRIAMSSIDGSMGKITFSSDYNNAVVEIDALRIPGATEVSGTAMAVLAYGAVSIVQTSYNNSDDPVATARATLAKLMNGTWTPGNPRAGTAEPDELILALAKHLSMSPEDVESIYIPKYAEKHGFGALGPARRKLRQHPDIAASIAVIAAERAKRTAAAVKGQRGESLAL